jgi:hypothetical protein
MEFLYQPGDSQVRVGWAQPFCNKIKIKEKCYFLKLHYKHVLVIQNSATVGEANMERLFMTVKLYIKF